MLDISSQKYKQVYYQISEESYGSEMVYLSNFQLELQYFEKSHFTIRYQKTSIVEPTMAR